MTLYKIQHWKFSKLMHQKVMLKADKKIFLIKKKKIIITKNRYSILTEVTGSRIQKNLSLICNPNNNNKKNRNVTSLHLSTTAVQHTHRTHWAHSTQASHTAAYTVQTDSHSQHSTAHFTEKKFIEHLFGWILALDWRQSSPIACQERIIDPAWWNSAPLLVGQCAQSISGDVTRRIYTMSDDSYVFKPFCMASFFGIVRMVWWYCVRIRGWLSVCVCCSIALRCALCVLLSCLISLSSHCFDRLPSLCSTLDVVAAVAFASAVVAATAAHLDCRLHNISWFLGILKKNQNIHVRVLGRRDTSVHLAFGFWTIFGFVRNDNVRQTRALWSPLFSLCQRHFSHDRNVENAREGEALALFVPICNTKNFGDSTSCDVVARRRYISIVSLLSAPLHCQTARKNWR